jgi:tripartite-type tricarboxylate transporter receptor subunit TctC
MKRAFQVSCKRRERIRLGLGLMLLSFFGLLHMPLHAAEAYPIRPIRLIVPFAPGGGTDATARLVGQPLSERFGQPVVIDNRPGAGTMLGTELTARSAPDGYTIMIASASHAINPTLYSKVNYDPLRDFRAITMAISFPFILAVHPALPVQSVKELIAHSKANPGKISYASSGIGSTNHLAGELFKRTAGIDMLHVSYKGGGPAMVDVMSGHVQSIFGTVVQTMPQVRAGKLKGLAVSSAKRAAFAPDVRTIAEDGLPGFDVTGWYGFIAPAAVPSSVVVRLNQEMMAILRTAAVQERLLALGTEPWPTSPEQAQAFIGAEVLRWGKLIRDARITAN